MVVCGWDWYTSSFSPTPRKITTVGPKVKFGLKKTDFLWSKKEKVSLKVRKNQQKLLNQLDLSPIF